MLAVPCHVPWPHHNAQVSPYLSLAPSSPTPRGHTRTSVHTKLFTPSASPGAPVIVASSLLRVPTARMLFLASVLGYAPPVTVEKSQVYIPEVFCASICGAIASGETNAEAICADVDLC